MRVSIECMKTAKNTKEGDKTMKTYKHFILIVVLVMAFSLAGMKASAFAIDSKLSRESLRGIAGIYVLVENFSPEEKRAGFSKKQVQTDVELKLRLVGIKVLNKEEHLEASGRPHLYVSVDTVSVSQNFFYYVLSIEIWQNVSLERNANFNSKAMTWSWDTMGHGKTEHIRTHLKDKIDVFINAYLSVNPKT